MEKLSVNRMVESSDLRKNIQKNVKIREFEDNDLEFVQETDFLLWLEIQYHSDYSKENIFTAVDEENKVIGIASLSFHSTWYAMEKDILHKLKYDIAVKEDNEDAEIIKSLLMDRLIEKFNAYKKKYQEKDMCICGWCDADDIKETQFLLSKGYAMSKVIPVLKYDLTKEIKHYDIPENIMIKEFPVMNETVAQYIEATRLAYEGIADSKGEVMFRTGGEGFRIFVATEHEKIVSSITLWDIEDGRSASENIFTIPEYRRKNIAHEVIATGLQALKDSDKKIATLSMDGTNLNAMKLYLSIGYDLMYTTIEMRYDG